MRPGGTRRLSHRSQEQVLPALAMRVAASFWLCPQGRHGPRLALFLALITPQPTRLLLLLLHTGSHGRGFHRVAHSNAMLHTGLKSAAMTRLVSVGASMPVLGKLQHQLLSE